MDFETQASRPQAVRSLLPPKIPGRRAVTDYNSSMVRHMHGAYHEFERPSASWIVQMAAPHLRAAVDNIPVKYLHTSSNKEKHAINIVRWTPEGRRLLTCSASGEFTLWNGTAFNFETLMQAHDHSIRAATFSHDGDWLVSGDMDGHIRYHNRDFNRVNELDAHSDCIRDIAFSPNDSKFVTASDDATLKIFDFSASQEVLNITGHSWEAKTVDWHPTKGLLVSGSKDHQVKLWEPRSGKCLTTLHGHKNTIVKTSFDLHTGDLLASCARDNVARIFDLRMMRDVSLLRGHNKEITTLAWHPIHPNLISTGSHDGAIHHYLLDEPNTPADTAASIPPYDSPDPSSAPAQTIWPAYKIEQAHAMAVWSMAWHPLGHILTSGGNDRCTRFWTRARPGENLEELRSLFAGHVQTEEPETQTEGLKPSTTVTNALGLPGLADPEERGLVGLSNNDDDEPPSRSRDMTMPIIDPYQQQNMPYQMPAQGVPPMFNGMGAAGIPGMQGVPNIPGDPGEFMRLVREGRFPPPPPPGFSGMPPGLPPPPGVNAPGMPGVAPPGIAPFNGMNGMSGMNNLNGANGANGMDQLRQRIPLPSQLEGFKEEQRKGNYRRAR